MILLLISLKSDLQDEFVAYTTLSTFFIRDMEGTSSTC